MTHLDTSQRTEGTMRLLTPAEAAEYLGCSKSHVYRLISGGALPAVNIAAPGSTRSKSRIRVGDLVKLIDKTSF